jgi:hypothetical protein
MKRMAIHTAALAALMLTLGQPSPAGAQDATIFGRAVQRDGLHFQVAFGWGGGTPGGGLFHNMELGGTFANGMTLAYNHVFIQLRGWSQAEGDMPDLIGGHLLQWKIPLLYDDLVLKLALGPGGTHDQSDGITAHWGLGWSYGLDLHLPVWATSGLTLGFTGVHVVTEWDGAHAGWALSLGYTWF